MLLTVDLYTTESWSIYHRHKTDSPSRCIHEILIDTCPIVYHFLNSLSTDYPRTIDRLSTMSRPIWQSIYQLTIPTRCALILQKFGWECARSDLKISRKFCFQTEFPSPLIFTSGRTFLHRHWVPKVLEFTFSLTPCFKQHSAKRNTNKFWHCSFIYKMHITGDI